jgi:hypothetical protein
MGLGDDELRVLKAGRLLPLKVREKALVDVRRVPDSLWFEIRLDALVERCLPLASVRLDDDAGEGGKTRLGEIGGGPDGTAL